MRMTIRARLGLPVPLKRGGAKSRQRPDALGAMIFKPAAPADATTTKEKKKKKKKKKKIKRTRHTHTRRLQDKNPKNPYLVVARIVQVGPHG